MRTVVSHPWDVSPEEAIRIQEKLRERICLRNRWTRPAKIAAMDVAYSERKATGGVLLFKYPELTLLEKVIVTVPVNFPYIPGLLTWREGPPLVRVLKKLREEPDLLMFDGQGIAHPRRMGIASHLGVCFQKPSLGCAKSKLTGECEQPGQKAGSSEPLYHKDELLGFVVRTKQNTRPVFVSPGNLIDPRTTLEVILKCCRGYRIPEPLRLVHIFVTREKRSLQNCLQ